MNIERKKVMNFKIAITIICSILVVFGFLSSCTVIDSGTVGVVKNLGAAQPAPLTEGLHFVRPLVSSVVKIDVKLRKIDAEAAASSKDLQLVQTHITVQYSVKPSLAPNIVQKFGTVESLEDNIISPAIQESLKAVTAIYTAEHLISKRGEVKLGIDNTLTAFIDHTMASKNVRGAIQISNIAITNFSFSSEFNAAIESKVKAEQDAYRAENEKKKSITDAEAAAAKKKLQADAEAYSINAESTARAAAIKREADALAANQQLIQYKIAEKWNGQLPTYNGGGVLPMLNIK